MTKLDLLKQTKVLSLLYYNKELSFSAFLARLNEINVELEELDSEEEYHASLKDCLDSPQGFLYKE